MKRSSPQPLKLSALTLATLACVQLAQAQQAQPTEATRNAATSSTKVADQQTLEQVTVSARRRAEAQEDVPSGITVLKGKELSELKLERVQDIQQVLPSTNVAFIHARQASVAVRGIGNNPAADGLDGSVGVYLDNVFLARPGMAVTEILDVDQIELLRGPQGTLFGKNTTAGVLNIGTKKPSFTDERSVEISAGQRGYRQAKASLSGPFSDTLAGRVVLYQTDDKGDVTNLYNGEKLNGGTRRGVRGQLLAVPGADLDVRVIADYHEERSSYGTTVPYFAGTAFRTRAAAAGATNIPTDPSQYQVNQDSKQQSNANHGGVSTEVNWTLPNEHKLTSITAWRFWDFEPKNDDQTNAPGLVSGGVKVRDRQLSQELRLASPKSDRLDYVVGAYYFRQNLDNLSFSYYGPQADNLFGTPAGTLNNFSTESPGQISTTSLALFGQATAHLTPKVELTTGLRLTKENKDASVVRNAPVNGSGVALANSALTAAQVPRIGAWSSGNLNVNDLSPSALVSLSRKLDDGALVYASYSHGEKSGGVNLAPATGPALGASSLLVGPEKANDLEVGYKGRLLQDRVQYGVNLFVTNISGYQANTLQPHPTLGWNSPVNVLTNVGSIQSRGIELDANARLNAQWSLRLSASYNDAHYTDFRNAPCSYEARAAGKTVCDLTGSAVVGAPKWIANLGARHDTTLDSGLRQSVVANYALRSKSEGAIDDSQFARIPGYGLLNTAISWRKPLAGKQAVEWSLWARNLLDKRYYTSVFQYPAYADLYTAAVGLPRTVGVTLRYDL